jgi:hypothetical protein
MKRDNHLLERIADMENLRLAFWKSCKGKAGKADVETFRQSLDSNLLKLRSTILARARYLRATITILPFTTPKSGKFAPPLLTKGCCTTPL